MCPCALECSTKDQYCIMDNKNKFIQNYILQQMTNKRMTKEYSPANSRKTSH